MQSWLCRALASSCGCAPSSVRGALKNFELDCALPRIAVEFKHNSRAVFNSGAKC